MTVYELIELLEGYSRDMRVAINRYDQGYDDLSSKQIAFVRIALDTGTHEWEGQHGDSVDAPVASSGPVQTGDALVLRRVSN